MKLSQKILLLKFYKYFKFSKFLNFENFIIIKRFLYKINMTTKVKTIEIDGVTVPLKSSDKPCKKPCEIGKICNISSGAMCC